MKKITLLIMAIISITMLFAQATDLFISEYIEGASNNKALEIYNGTGLAVDLSNYSLKLGGNGNAWSTVLVLSGSLASGEVYVIANSAAVSEILDQADITSGVTYFNGDDAIGLFKNDVLIDLFGTYQVDPGTAWNVAGVTNATLDHTLVRKASVNSPSINWVTSAGTTTEDSEWIVYAVGTNSYLGSHTMNSGTPSSYPPVISNFAALTTPPAEDVAIELSATVTDADDNLAVVEIGYKINNETNPHFINMTEATPGSGNFTGAIPATEYANADLVEYWISAMDSGTGDDFHAVESTHYKLLAGTTPILKLREVNTETYVPLYNSTLVRVTGTASTSDGMYNPGTYIDSYIQDSQAGINLFLSNNTLGIVVVENINYTVVGTVSHYNGKTQINPSSIISNGIFPAVNFTLKTIDELLANPERYEGMLIGITNANKVSGTWPALNSNSSITISQTGSTNNLTLYIDKDTEIDGTIEPTWPIDIKGLFIQYDSSSPHNSGYQILPRLLSDLTPSGTLPVTFSSFTATLSGSNTVSLEWITQSESSLSGFYIYRSTNNNTLTADRVSNFIPATNTSTQSCYTFNDNEVAINHTYYYWVVSTEQNGHTEWYGSCSINVNENIIPQLPSETALFNTYPNPLNINKGQANFTCKVKENETANLIIYNLKGQIVKSYSLNSGNHTLNWDCKDQNGKKCSTGVYFYKLSSPTITSVRKMMLIK